MLNWITTRGIELTTQNELNSAFGGVVMHYDTHIVPRKVAAYDGQSRYLLCSCMQVYNFRRHEAVLILAESLELL